MKIAVRTVVALFVAMIAVQASAQTTISVGNTPTQPPINASANWCNQESSPITTVSSGTLSVPFDILISKMSVTLNSVNITGSGWDGQYSQNGYHTGYSITGPNGATVVLMPVEWINYQCFFYQALKNFEFVDIGGRSLLTGITSYSQGTSGLWWSDGTAYGYPAGYPNSAFYSYQSFSPFLNGSSAGTWKLNVTAYDYEDGYWGPGCPTNVTVAGWSVNFQGTYGQASILSQTLFATNTTTLGLTSTENIVLTNFGTRPLQVTALNPISGFTSDYTIDPSITLPLTISNAAGSNQVSIPIIFKPKGVLSRAAVFQLVTTGLDVSVNPPVGQVFQINMLGTGGAALLNAAIPNSFLFRTMVSVKDTVVKYFKISNPGSQTLFIQAYDKSGGTPVGTGSNGLVIQNFVDPNGNLTSGAADYKIIYPPALALNSVFILQSGQQDSVGVQFSPKGEGARIANLIIRSNAANVVSPVGFTSADSIVYMLQGVGLASHFTTTYTNFGQVNQGDTAYAKIYVHNTGTGNLKFFSQTLIEGDLQQFKIVSFFHPPVLPDSIDSMTVMFHPDSLGFLYTKIGLLTNALDADSSKIIDMQGIGRPVANGIFTPTTLFKSDTGEVGAAPITRTVSVQNVGSTVLNVSDVVFGGADSMNYSVKSGIPAQVQPGKTQTIIFAFNPAKGHGGASSGYAIVHSNNKGGGANTISLLGYSCELSAVPTPDSMFVGVVIDTSESQQDVVTLTNTGNCPIALSTIQITGPDANLYSLVPPLPTFIGPNDSVHVTVKFKTDRVTPQTPIASLRVATNSKSDSVVTLPLLARGCFFKVLAVPAPQTVLFDHDLTTPNNDTLPTTVLVDNTGCIPLILTSVSVDGPDADQYPVSLVKYPTNPIQPNVIDSVIIYFVRTSPGLKVARAVISTNSNEIPTLVYYLGVTTGVREIGTTVNSFELYQNYPNPFNPSTRIEYDVPRSGVVKLEILNTLGEPIAVVENSRMEAGRYTSTFDASTLPSGSYFYRLTAGGFTQTRVMNLIK